MKSPLPAVFPAPKIENVPVGQILPLYGGRNKTLVDLLMKLEVGQSFLWPKDTNARVTVAIVQQVLSRTYKTVKAENGVRIGRIA